MSKLPKSFNSKKHTGRKGDYAVSTDQYIGRIVDSEYKENKAKTGSYLRFDFVLQNKKVKGHKIPVFLNLDHEKETVVEMAEDELGSICDACNFTGELKDSKALHGKQLILHVRKIDADGNSPASNTIDMYEALAKGTKVKGEKKKDKKKKEPEVTVDDVKDLARKAKKEDSEAFEEALEEYDISKMSEIKTLEEDDLVGLKEDLEDILD